MNMSMNTDMDMDMDKDINMDTDLAWAFLVRLGVTSHYWLPVKNILGLYKVKILFPTFGYLYRTDLNYF
jgi:hypothetical protein